MTTNHHTPHAVAAPVTAAQFNARLGELDAGLTGAITAGFVDAATTLDAQALSGQAVVPVVSTDGFTVGEPVWIGTVGGGLQETKIILSIQAGVSLTMTTNLASTHEIGEPVTRSPAELVHARGTFASLGERIGLLGRRIADVRVFGAAGNGTTDDLGAFEAAASSLGAGGGGTIYIPDGDYKLSDSWIIELDRVDVVLSANASVFTDGATATGGTIGFVGHDAGPGLPIEDEPLTPQKTWASIRGGHVYNLNNGTLDNAIGFVRYKNARVEGVHITGCGRKAITAQVGVDNVYFVNNTIDNAGTDAITVEAGCKRIYIAGNTVLAADDRAIAIIAVPPTHPITDVLISGNIVTSTGAGIWVADTTRSRITGNFVTAGAAAGGIFVGGGESADVSGNTLTSAGQYPILVDNVATAVRIDGNTVLTISGAANSFDAIYVEDLTCRPQISNNYIDGTNTRYLINAGSNMGSFAGVYMGNHATVTGQTGMFGGTQPLLGLNFIAGAPVKTGTW